MATTSSPAPQAGADAQRSQFARDILAGLSATPKRASPKYFYDETGSVLFDRITEQPEYYPTRTEIGILETKAAEIAGLIPAGAALVEFGSVPSTKARILLTAATTLGAYVPVDIAAEDLRREADGVARDFPQLPVFPVAADFMQVFALPKEVEGMPRAGFFPGSTIGNMEPHEATRFLQRAGKVLGDGAAMIVGVDMIKDPKVLNAAYNDAAGVTAAFNLNLLDRINRELGGCFEPGAFEHHAFYNGEKRRVEMHLASLRRQKVRINGHVVNFEAGETIHTESSYKYSVDSFAALARGAGWQPAAVWTDPGRNFSIHALRLERQV